MNRLSNWLKWLQYFRFQFFNHLFIRNYLKYLLVAIWSNYFLISFNLF